MPSITAKNRLRLFASASDGPTICLALKDFDAGDGDSVVLIHRPGDAQSWIRIDLPFDVMDVALTPDPGTQGARYMALASTGEAIFLADPPIVTRVNPEGLFRQIEPGKGMLSAFDVADGTLLALGRGGQAYRLGETGEWRLVWTTPPIEDEPTDHINFLCAGARGSARELYFGGVSEPKDNADAFYDFLMSDGDDDADLPEARENYGTLWLLQGTRWSKIDLPTSGIITNLLEWDGGKLFVSDNRGLVAEMAAPDRVEEIYTSGDQKGVADLVQWNKQLIVVLTDEIIALDLDADTEDSLPVPNGFEALQNLHPTDDGAWLVDWRGLARWNGSDWEEVAIPRPLLR